MANLGTETSAARRTLHRPPTRSTATLG